MLGDLTRPFVIGTTRKGQHFIVSPEDADLLTLRWHIGDGYVRKHTGPPTQGTKGIHRYIAERLGIQAPILDHINRDKLDNRRCNIRAATAQQNSLNRDPFTTSNTGHTGVYWDPSDKRWVIRIGKRKACITTCLEDAVALRKKWYEETFTAGGIKDLRNKNPHLRKTPRNNLLGIRGIGYSNTTKQYIVRCAGRQRWVKTLTEAKELRERWVNESSQKKGYPLA